MTLPTSKSFILQTVRNIFPTHDFQKKSSPVVLMRTALLLITGWSVTAKIIDLISKSYPFGKKIKTPISMSEAFCMVLLGRISPISAIGIVESLATIVFGSSRVKTSYSPEGFKSLLFKKHPFPSNIIVTDIAFGSSRVKTTYSPEEFKSLLFKKHHFPPNIIVTGEVDLSDCMWWVTSLPEGLTVQGPLTLSHCRNLTSLPVRLTVQGPLLLFGCTGLTSLPEGLIVRGILTLLNCTGLTSLPEELTVEGNLNLSGCTGLISLPNWITTLGLRADGNTRQIYVERIGLSEALLNRLRETDTPGIQFHFSNTASVPAVAFLDLDTALTFWVKATNDATLTNPPITIDSESALPHVLEFLGRLTETAEYKNSQAKPLLAKRVIEAFSLMAENESIKGRALDLIHQGLTSCDDRIISALEEIELMVLLHKIENTSHTEPELRALGKSFLLLEMVNEKAKAHKNTLTWVDEIEIYLAFQIGLAEKLNLPMKTRNMFFRGCAQITDEQIKQAGDAVLTACTEEKLNNFLKRWSPWIEHQRKNGPVPTYEDLPVIERKLESGEICPIMQDIPERPVLYDKTVYDYDALIHCYRTSGKNPLDRSKIDLEKLKRIVT